MTPADRTLSAAMIPTVTLPGSGAIHLPVFEHRTPSHGPTVVRTMCGRLGLAQVNNRPDYECLACKVASGRPLSKHARRARRRAQKREARHV